MTKGSKANNIISKKGGKKQDAPKKIFKKQRGILSYIPSLKSISNGSYKNGSNGSYKNGSYKNGSKSYDLNKIFRTVSEPDTNEIDLNTTPKDLLKQMNALEDDLLLLNFLYPFYNETDYEIEIENKVYDLLPFL